jgi:hypothetical protein
MLNTIAPRFPVITTYISIEPSLKMDLCTSDDNRGGNVPQKEGDHLEQTMIR